MLCSTLKLKFYKLRIVTLFYLFKLLSKLLFVEFPPLFSVAALIEKEGKLLFLDLSYQNGLGLPGGMVAGGETLEEALSREVVEETGLKITQSQYFTSVAVSSFRGLPTSSVIFLVKTSGQIRASEEGTLLWLKPTEAIDQLFYQDGREALQKYLEKTGGH